MRSRGRFPRSPMLNETASVVIGRFEVARQTRSVLCRVALRENCGTVLGDEFCPSFPRIHLTANERTTASSKQSHSAIRHTTDPVFCATSIQNSQHDKLDAKLIPFVFRMFYFGSKTSMKQRKWICTYRSKRSW